MDRSATIFGVIELVQGDVGSVGWNNCVGYVEHFENVLSITAKEIGREDRVFPNQWEIRFPRTALFFGLGLRDMWK